MNRFARDVISIFLSDPNREYLFKALTSQNGSRSDQRSDAWPTNLSENMFSFAALMERDLGMSSPLPGTDARDHVHSFNMQFIDFANQRRQIHLSPRDVEDEGFSLGDGHRLTRNPDESADDMLNRWRSAPGRQYQMREDPGNRGSHRCRERVECSELDYFLKNRANCAGIDYYDFGSMNGPHGLSEDAIGTNSHVSRYENTSYKLALNTCGPGRTSPLVKRESVRWEPAGRRTGPPLEGFASRDQRACGSHYDTPFGVSTPAADARLLSRRVFREDNRIPVREQKLYRRNLDRDIDESLAGEERGCMPRGFDMKPLYTRATAYSITRPRPENKMNLFVGDHSAY